MPELIDFFRADHGRALHVLAEHVADSHGDCRACPVAVQLGLYREWPCTLHRAAALAYAGR